MKHYLFIRNHSGLQYDFSILRENSDLKQIYFMLINVSSKKGNKATLCSSYNSKVHIVFWRIFPLKK